MKGFTRAVLAACAVSVVTCAALVPAIAQAPANMKVADAHKQAEAGEVVLVDVRTPEEWRETGVPASGYAITMHQNPRVFLQQLDQALGGDRKRPLAVICRTGNRTGSLMPELKRLGYNVIDVGEGMAGSRAGPGWLKAGLPVRKGASIAAAPKVSVPAVAAPTAPGAK